MPESIVLLIVLLSNEGKSLSDLIQASYLMEIYVWTKKFSHVKNRRRPELSKNFSEVPGTEKTRKEKHLAFMVHLKACENAEAERKLI